MGAPNQIGRIPISAPERIRTKYGRLKGTAHTDALARLRPSGDPVHTRRRS
ncbi:hypothetical protein ABZ330_30940 [Streptomyces sp. NPDC006172]|uniref:hypothetical protein n=1 Tax=Streptomyces sp. NPDC006172 TaxID=3154470 RepID=UPI0033E95C89